MAKHMP
jgi:hypothetical protein